MQAPAPAPLYVPGRHGNAVPLVDPGGHAYPAVHDDVHAVARPVAAENRPASHCVGVALPAAQKAPAGHTVHVVELSVALYWPAGQSTHTAAPREL